MIFPRQLTNYKRKLNFWNNNTKHWFEKSNKLWLIWPKSKIRSSEVKISSIIFLLKNIVGKALVKISRFKLLQCWAMYSCHLPFWPILVSLITTTENCFIQFGEAILLQAESDIESNFPWLSFYPTLMKDLIGGRISFLQMTSARRMPLYLKDIISIPWLSILLDKLWSSYFHSMLIKALFYHLLQMMPSLKIFKNLCDSDDH